MQEYRNQLCSTQNGGGVESHSINVSKGFYRLNPYFLVQYFKSQVKADFKKVNL